MAVLRQRRTNAKSYHDMIVNPVNGPSSIQIDANLWVLLHDCSGKHYLLYNPHTFIGRIAAYCESKNRLTNISKAEIADTSLEAKYWLKGFFAGCEPDCPKTEDGDTLPDDHPHVIEWREAIREFPKTGLWYSGAHQCLSCGAKLLPTTLGEHCRACTASEY